MKKLSSVLLLFCFALPVFAQVSVNGWGRVVWMPLFIDQDGEPRSVIQAPWGEEPDFEFYLRGVTPSKKIGVDVDFFATKGTAELGNIQQIANLKAWWSPNQYFKLHMGAGRVPALRGKVYGSTGTYAYARGRHTGFTSQGGIMIQLLK
jgi:hypothetical protein